VQVPPDYAAEMVPFDPLSRFRVHYAGFSIPASASRRGGRVLRGAGVVHEVRSSSSTARLGRLVYEKMLARPDALYGQRIGSTTSAGLKLSKHFRV